MRRRNFAVIIALAGIAALGSSQSAEARHRRRCRRQCEVYYYQPCDPSACQQRSASPAVSLLTGTTITCPKYKMMSMGGLSHYYALQYSGTCFSASVPVSYDSSSGSLATPCQCGASGTCCKTVASAPCNPSDPAPCLEKVKKKGDHVQDPMLKEHSVNKGIKPTDSIKKHYNLESKTKLDSDGEFLVKVTASPVVWLRVGRFTYKNDMLDIPVLVGYEVDAPGGSATFVNVPPENLKIVDGFDNIYTLMISGEPNGAGGGERDGEYQIVRAK